MDNSNLLIKNILDNKDDIKKMSDLFSNTNSLAIPLGLALSKNSNIKRDYDKHLKDGEVDNSIFEKLINLVSTDNYKPKISIKEQIISHMEGKQFTKKNKKSKKLNKSRKNYI